MIGKLKQMIDEHRDTLELEDNVDFCSLQKEEKDIIYMYYYIQKGCYAAATAKLDEIGGIIPQSELAGKLQILFSSDFKDFMDGVCCGYVSEIGCQQCCAGGCESTGGWICCGLCGLYCCGGRNISRGVEKIGNCFGCC